MSIEPLNPHRLAQGLRLAAACFLFHLLVCVEPARAQFPFSWNKPNGGSYNVSDNWDGISLGGIPDAPNESALFNLDEFITRN